MRWSANEAIQLCRDRAQRRVGPGDPTHRDKIHGWPAVAVDAKSLAQQSFETRPLRRVAGALGHRKSDPRNRRLRRGDRKRNTSPARPTTGAQDVLQIAPLPQAMAAAQMTRRSRGRCGHVNHGAMRRGDLTYFLGVDTARRLRPLARRRLITLTPFAVDMRLRKPCVRRRAVRLGVDSPFFTARSPYLLMLYGSGLRRQDVNVTPSATAFSSNKSST